MCIFGVIILFYQMKILLCYSIWPGMCGSFRRAWFCDFWIQCQWDNICTRRHYLWRQWDAGNFFLYIIFLWRLDCILVGITCYLFILKMNMIQKKWKSFEWSFMCILFLIILCQKFGSPNGTCWTLFIFLFFISYMTES